MAQRIRDSLGRRRAVQRVGVALSILAMTTLGLGACEADLVSEVPSACSEAGAQCQLPAGPLGVCERSPCPAGVDSPCFTCTPQH